MATLPTSDLPVVDPKTGRINLQWYAALRALISEIATFSGGGVNTFEGRSGNVVSVAGDYTASEIDFNAAGTISASDVQAALEELDTEKVATTRQIISGDGLTGGGNLSADRTLAVGAGTGISVAADSVSTNDAQIVHDNLSGFVANEHVDHSGVTLTAGNGLTGGGDITVSRSFAVGAGTGITVNADDVELNITGLTGESSPATGDELPFQDVSASAKRKITLAEMLSVVSSLGDVTSFGSGDKILVIEGGTAKKADYDNLPGAAGAGITAIALQAFEASGTYTPTSGMEYCIVISTGAGGGGGGLDSDGGSNAGGGGGGGGATCIELFNAATIGASQTVTIGTAGTAGTNTGGDGGAGGDTTFGALHTAGGGAGGGGTNATANNNTDAGGAGGTATGGLINIPGGNGGSGFGAVLSDVDIVYGGGGGASFWGQTSQANISFNASANGTTGTIYGSGGGGARNVDNTAGNTGGAGAAGFCLVIEFV